MINISVMELRVGNKYRLGRKIGSGSFGDIYLGIYYLESSMKLIIFFRYRCHEWGRSCNKIRMLKNQTSTVAHREQDL